MKIKYLYIALSLMFGLFACQTNSSTEDKKESSSDESEVILTEAQKKNAGIVVSQAEKKAMHANLKVNGVIDVPPQNLVSVSFPLGGYLKSSELLPGMKIKKGQVIAVMEDQMFIQLQQDYLIAKSKLEMAQKEYERQKQLNESKTSSDKVFELAKNDFQSQRITWLALAEKLRLIGLKPETLQEDNISRTVNIYSPIEGYVADVKVNIGKYVNPADVLFELVNPADLHLALTVFEKDVPNLKIGQKVEASLVNHPEKKWMAEIILIGRNLDANRSTVIHCHFIDQAEDLLPGMFLSANIEVINNEAIAVPEEAVVRFGVDEFLFVEKEPLHYVLTKVKTGVKDNGFVEIFAEDPTLTQKNIITKNAYTVLMKMKNKAE